MPTQVLIQPEFQSSLRNLTSEVSAKALYSSGRTALSDKLLAEMNEKLNPRGIIVEQVGFRASAQFLWSLLVFV